jgi:hypothetical protein
MNGKLVGLFWVAFFLGWFVRGRTKTAFPVGYLLIALELLTIAVVIGYRR